MSQAVQRWDAATKRTVATILLVLLALFIYRFRGVLPPLVLAFLLAFVLDPLVDLLERRTRMSRTAATTLVFLLVVLLLLAAPAIAIPSIVRAVRSLNLDFLRIAVDLGRMVQQPVTLFGYEWNLEEVYVQLLDTLRNFMQTVAAGTFNLVVGFASTLFWLVFILLAAFYLTRDADRLTEWLDTLPPPSIREDAVRLRQQITEVWNAFLRGQLLMGILMTVITTVVTTAVGLPNALALGLLAGLMEFVPSIGPIIAAIPAVLLAFFQGSSWLPLSNFWFAVLVLGLYLVIQQIEGNILLPRVLGSSLKLHPLVVLIAVIAGGSLAGILGMLLAAPTVATLRVLAHYLYCRLTDRDPFPEAPPMPSPRRGLGRRLWDRARRRFLSNRWSIRSARPEDQEDVEALCAQIWEDHDYIPEVWQEWLNDSNGQLSVVTLKGRVVGLGKLTRIAEDEWWLEGLRVDPDYRRLGVARLLQSHHVTLAEQVGRGVLRFATASWNLPVHRNAVRDGFRRVAEFLAYEAPPLPGPCPLRRLTSDDLDAVWERIADSPILQAAGGLYEVQWHWMTLTRERLAGHLEQGEVWGVELEGRLTGVAVVQEDPDRKRLSVGYVDGEPEGITALAWGLRVLAYERGCEKLRFRPPTYPPLLEALEAAGAVQVWEHGLWIFERPLKGENERGRD
ncbi:MAG TPA: AI-2E family transporter [Anaerolineales bacterium]|nr:AI-2E family transporter [Anaerolineales bacterium]